MSIAISYNHIVEKKYKKVNTLLKNTCLFWSRSDHFQYKTLNPQAIKDTFYLEPGQ